MTGRGLNGQRQYTFTSPAVRKQAELHAGPGFKVEQERERVWAAWLSRRALPPWDAVRFLTTSGPTLPPLQALLLLRAAVASDAPRDAG